MNKLLDTLRIEQVLLWLKNWFDNYSNKINLRIDLVSYTANVGDAVLYDGSGFICVSPDKINSTDYPSDKYTPIGVVAIPSSHDVYGDGSAGVISLKYMNLSTPNEGSVNFYSMHWGGNGTDTSLKNFATVPQFGDASLQTEQRSATPQYACLPSDNFSGPVSNFDPLAKYKSISYPAIPSPYLSDGSRNPTYYDVEENATNALSDFDGAGNTKTLCDLITVEYWKTINTIPNSYSAGNYPAAAACWRYITDGTNQGDWYLPACGELGYVIVRFKAINETISALKTAYGSTICSELSTGDGYWSSSEYMSSYARSIKFGTGDVSYASKNFTYYVRAFTRIKFGDNTKVDKSSIVQTTGNSETSIMSLKAVTDALSSIQPSGNDINVVQATGESSEDVMSQNAVTLALANKLDISNITLELGSDINKVLSLKAATDAINDARNLFAGGFKFKGSTPSASNNIITLLDTEYSVGDVYVISDLNNSDGQVASSVKYGDVTLVDKYVENGDILVVTAVDSSNHPISMIAIQGNLVVSNHISATSALTLDAPLVGDGQKTAKVSGSILLSNVVGQQIGGLTGNNLVVPSILVDQYGRVLILNRVSATLFSGSYNDLTNKPNITSISAGNGITISSTGQISCNWVPARYYTGSTAPVTNTGSDGDLYLQING